ncbi:Ran-specific GTPase-activating protein 1 [Cyphellophora attinorum]|uniref:Ran-specific GTPase-activating protein 1 n=1 Tax=Cyphellophora attinorum TaxID=1664694 RepID=A0A0N0NL28_9EURO|nr:Ran-specific GTPase-activating protein 1 [Phialophora attinorum]KPI38549.1 Ran-specific GTPase-activating protein 1 [Phialophora attinorum]
MADTESKATPAAEQNSSPATTEQKTSTTQASTVTETATAAASNVASTATAAAAGVKDSVFSMFGGGAKKEKKEEVEDEDAKNEPSGSSKAKKDAEDDDDDKAEEEEADVHFEPVVKLTEKVDTKTHEEAESVEFKMRAKLFKFDRDSVNGRNEVLATDKTLKVCANHYVTPDMKLSPNVGSDRSWVWNVAADVSEGEPEASTLAIRFANSENANLFKEAFIKAQQENEKLFGS